MRKVRAFTCCNFSYDSVQRPLAWLVVMIYFFSHLRFPRYLPSGRRYKIQEMMIILRMKIQDGAAHTERGSWWSRATSPTTSSSPRWGSLVIIAIVISITIITIIIVIFICVLHAYPIVYDFPYVGAFVFQDFRVAKTRTQRKQILSIFRYCEIVKIRWASRSRMSLKRTVASRPGHQSPPPPPPRQVVLSTGEHDDNDFEFYENI